MGIGVGRKVSLSENPLAVLAEASNMTKSLVVVDYSLTISCSNDEMVEL